MPVFGKRSTHRLGQAHPELQRLFREVVRRYDCTVLTGHRGRAAQNRAFREGRSTLKWPNGKHNRLPSTAVDVAPYPVDWNDAGRFRHFAGYVQGVAAQLDIPIRWGGDWDGDFDMTDQALDDLMHFEYLEGG